MIWLRACLILAGCLALTACRTAPKKAVHAASMTVAVSPAQQAGQEQAKLPKSVDHGAVDSSPGAGTNVCPDFPPASDVPNPPAVSNLSKEHLDDPQSGQGCVKKAMEADCEDPCYPLELGECPRKQRLAKPCQPGPFLLTSGMPPGTGAIGLTPLIVDDAKSARQESVAIIDTDSHALALTAPRDPSSPETHSPSLPIAEQARKSVPGRQEGLEPLVADGVKPPGQEPAAKSGIPLSLDAGPGTRRPDGRSQSASVHLPFLGNNRSNIVLASKPFQPEVPPPHSRGGAAAKEPVRIGRIPSQPPVEQSSYVPLRLGVIPSHGNRSPVQPEPILPVVEFLVGEPEEARFFTFSPLQLPLNDAPQSGFDFGTEAGSVFVTNWISNTSSDPDWRKTELVKREAAIKAREEEREKLHQYLYWALSGEKVGSPEN